MGQGENGRSRVRMGGAGRGGEWAEQVQFVVEPQQCAQLWVSLQINPRVEVSFRQMQLGRGWNVPY